MSSSQTYQQVLFDDALKQLVTINTQNGLFHYTRLLFGVPSAPGNFQHFMEKILEGIPNGVVYLDAILAASPWVHVKLLDEVLSRMQSAGLCLRQSKCTFWFTSVTYFGHTIDAELHGLHSFLSKEEWCKKHICQQMWPNLGHTWGCCPIAASFFHTCPQL